MPEGPSISGVTKMKVHPADSRISSVTTKKTLKKTKVNPTESRTFTTMTVNPADLRFTQDSIACHFKAPREHETLSDALEKIQTGKLSPEKFPLLRVNSYEGCLWSVDNRRLWLFRKAKCVQIDVRKMTTIHPRVGELISFSSRYKNFSRADFVPTVRGSRTFIPRALHLEAPDVMSRSAGVTSERVRGSQPVLPQMLNAASTELHRKVEGVMGGSKTQQGLPFSALEQKVWVIKIKTCVSPAGLRPDGTNTTKFPNLPLPALPEASGGRHPADRTDQPLREVKVCMPVCSHDHYTGPRTAPIHPGQDNSEHSRFLVSVPTDDDDIPNRSWLPGWVRYVIFECFGYAL